MPVHIKGGGGAGFPQGWKENFEAKVFENAISRGDPVVVGTYGDLLGVNGTMDVESTPVITGVAQSDATMNNEGTMFVYCIASAASNFVYVKNAGGTFDKVTLPAPATPAQPAVPLTRVAAAAFSDDGLYLATMNWLSTSYSKVVAIYRIDSPAVFTLISLVQVTAPASLTNLYCNLEFLDNTYRILAGTEYAFSLLAFDGTAVSVTNTKAPYGTYCAGFIRITDTYFILLAHGVTTNVVYELIGTTWSTNAIGTIYNSSYTYKTNDVTELLTYAVLSYNATPTWLHICKNSGGLNFSTKLANPDVMPASYVYCAAFDPSGTYLAIGIDVAPYMIIYKRDGDVFTKLANPTVMPTSGVYSITFTADNKHMLVSVGASPGVLCYSVESETIVSKITSFTDNPLDWFPGPRKRIGMAKDNGNPGDVIRVNLFPNLYNLPVV